MIIPSKQSLLISSQDRKEVHLFDPKTACVLYTYNSECALASTVAYFEEGREFVIPHLTNTFVNVWDTDAQEPRKFSVGDAQRIQSLKLLKLNLLAMGSSTGALFIFQLPSGILVRKCQLHSQSSQIKYIVPLAEGYLATGTKKQIKLWPMHQILPPLVDSSPSHSQKPISIRTLTIAQQIIGVQHIRGILCIITQRTVQFFYACSLSVFSISHDIGKIEHITCSSSSQGAIFIADQNKIKQIPIEASDKELAFEERKGKVSIINRPILQIEVKDPITMLVYVDSLRYLVSGNCKGEIKIWDKQVLKNSVQLFKSPISLLQVISRPQKNMKIPQSHKIRSFHKQQQTKTDQPILIPSNQERGQFGKCPTVTLQSRESSKKQKCDLYLNQMLSMLKDPIQQYQCQIDSLKRQNKMLIQANLGYQSAFQGLLEQNSNNNEPNGKRSKQSNKEYS